MQLFRGQPVAIGLLSTLLTTAYAQNDDDKDEDQSQTDAPAKTDLPDATDTGNTDAAQPTETNNDNADQTAAPTNQDNTAKPTETGNDNAVTPTPTSDADAVITGDSTGTNDVKVPQSTISGDTSESDAAGPTDLPVIPGGYKIPVAQVPPTLNAPFMQVSTLPAGTVFIVVGAILGFLALAVILWRGLTVWALKRSVKRAAKGNHTQDTKALLNFRPPAAPVYNRYSDRDSTLSLANLRKSPKPTRPTTSSGAAPGQSLFFSPTAGGSSMLNPGNRNSGYLPSGYYAAGASVPGNGSGMAHLGGSGLTAREAISLSNLGPQAKGYARAQSLGTTPPDSPRVGPALGPGAQHGAHLSTSTLDLTQRPGGRAPSAYLEDLFDEAGAAPGHYPVNHPNYQGGTR
ncbi:hypothetical protein V496_04242 [Pseudogymnoascus sp. VKM F-4515 (FW-2607)]|nr:hypothetical protein V496_04242 [Pseudogymnoascus sp. VKM F-4515 (FW-2607)]KFY98970.1 hypothetical protein V498_01107 [Pseudogymnoascus sp. VKM F-4517 (FW-2822)]